VKRYAPRGVAVSSDMVNRQLPSSQDKTPYRISGDIRWST
jgi:hypothetical protein